MALSSQYCDESLVAAEHVRI